ncbi:LysM peptidoglycan-binding domain-containing protein [Pseudarthrobacter scleromae]|uniref:LysM peptidoglycan-binding domain-containing protein n=1 Tax=Pseudarthrobacter scleromae TaxID=158897 RepID=UPI003632A931
MNKNTRRLSAAVTAAASAAVLATLIAAPANAADTYKVKSGDTLSAISGSTGVPLSTLFSANNLGWNTIIYPGQTINLGSAAPAAPAPAAPASSGGATYTVKAGDTLSAIAGRAGVSLHDLFALNNLGWNSIIYPGQVVKTSANQTPAPAAPAPAAPAATPAAPAPAAAPAAQTYTVKSGDSLWAISSRTGVALGTLYSLNNLSASSIIHPGQVIKLGGAASPAAPAPAPAAPAPAAPSTSGTESVAQIKSMITATAQSMGVDPALALAFGEQESSFRQNVTSSAGAIGVMQVIPSSGVWAPAVERG